MDAALCLQVEQWLYAALGKLLYILNTHYTF